MALRSYFPVTANAVPEQGSKGVLVNFDFTGGVNVVAGDLTLEQQSNAISFVQSIWVDNRANGQPFVLTFLGMNYTLQVRGGRQGMYPVYCLSGDIRFTATSIGAGIVVSTIMFNFNETPWWQDV